MARQYVGLLVATSQHEQAEQAHFGTAALKESLWAFDDAMLVDLIIHALYLLQLQSSAGCIPVAGALFRRMPGLVSHCYVSFGQQGAKIDRAQGIAFCGCQRNMHAVTGVKWGFRLVMCVWTRHPDAPVPLEQLRVCYFRPGSGLSIWLTSDDLHKYPKRRRKNEMLHDSEEEDADMHEASD